MPIKPTMTHDQFDRMISGIFERAGAQTDRLLIKRFQYLGERFVAYARDHGTYTDQTGNLRNSIGYVIYQDGKLVDEYFQPGISDEAYKSSTETYRRYGKELPPNGTILLIVAGMKYALKVESRGRDVLTSAELLAQKEVPKAIAELYSNVFKAISSAVNAKNRRFKL